MNLKESFRYQNYLAMLFTSISAYLNDRRNLVCVKQEHLRKSANPEAQDETVDATKERAYAQSNGTIIEFMKAVMEEKHSLAIAIGKAKAGCVIDIDAEAAHNSLRRGMAATLEHVCAIKPSECKTQGSDFKFNATGDQVRYFYDIKEITTIDFDRNGVKRLAKNLAREADEASSALDRCMIDVNVDFVPSFNVSDSVEDALEAFAAQKKIERHAV